MDVEPGSGAEKSGLKIGDVIIELAGKTVKTMQEINTIKTIIKQRSKSAVK